MIELFRSPIGPVLILLIGSIVQAIIGRWVRRPSWLTWIALFFVTIAGWNMLVLRFPKPDLIPKIEIWWRPLMQQGARFYWVADGWNWYVSCLILLLGGLAILLHLNNLLPVPRFAHQRNLHTTLSLALAVLAATLLFVNSGNLLTTIFSWVAMDVMALLRNAARFDSLQSSESTPSTKDKAAIVLHTNVVVPLPPEDVLPNTPILNFQLHSLQQSSATAIRLLGAMLLLIALLPEGAEGPDRAFHNSGFHQDTFVLILIAALIRTGIYPFHIWLLPNDGREQVRPLSRSERLLDHMVPVLTGLWLLGWSLDIGYQYINLIRLEISGLFVISILGSAIVAWTSTAQSNHATFVLITSAGLATLTGVLSYNNNPGGLLWATTTFALGGALWLVGTRVWQVWRWQIPVSVGALALAGVPFTPGFLMQPALANLFTGGSLFFPLFVIYVLAQTLQIAALLRSWGTVPQQELSRAYTGVMFRLLIVCFAIGLPLAIAGFLPGRIAELVQITNAIPISLGNPPTVVADIEVWITLGLPLAFGMVLALFHLQTRSILGTWATDLHRMISLGWLFQISWWVIEQVSELWGNTLRVIEGAGYMGWLAVFLLMTYLLMG